MRKQSFLERLTGTQTVTEDELTSTNESTAKPWSEAVDDTPEDVKNEEFDYHENEQYEDEDEDEDEPGLPVDIYESDNELVIQSMKMGGRHQHDGMAMPANMLGMDMKNMPMPDKAAPATDSDHH